METSERVVVKEGERAEVCVRNGETSFTLLINGPGSMSVVISKSKGGAISASVARSDASKA